MEPGKYFFKFLEQKKIVYGISGHGKVFIYFIGIIEMIYGIFGKEYSQEYSSYSGGNIINK